MRAFLKRKGNLLHMVRILHFYIPFFHYSDETKVIFSPESIYVFEYSPATTDGPVAYEDHFEGVLLKKVDGGWKVVEFLYNNIPDSILVKANTRK
jgi:hypothetical protein